MNEIEFIDVHGKKIIIDRNRIEFRPSSYGIILNEGKILLTVMRTTGKYTLPGGGLDKGETLHETLKREVKEETGIEIQIHELLFTKERNFYYEKADKPWQVFAFCYRAVPLSLDIRNTSDVEDEAETVVWVHTKELKVEDFQVFGEEVIAALQLLGA